MPRQQSQTKRASAAQQHPALDAFPEGYQPVHVVMRYSEQFLGVDDTVGEHQKIIRKKGSVAVGKFGRPLASGWVERLNKQIASGFKTSLYLVKKSPDGYAAFRLNVMRVTRDRDASIEKIIPKYYLEGTTLRRMTMWFVCDSVTSTKPTVLDSLHIASSGYSARRAILTSMAGMFVVKDGPGISCF